MHKNLVVCCCLSYGLTACSSLSTADRLKPTRPDAFLHEYDQQPLGVLKLKTLFAWLKDNPIETFKEMRAQRPVITAHAVPTKSGPKFTSTVVVANKQDVVEVLDRWESFSVKLYGSKMDEAMGPFMLGRDHSTYNLVEKPYMRSLMTPADFPHIKELVSTLTAEAVTQGTTITTDAKTGKRVGRIELVNSVARAVPIRLTGSYSGFPGPDEASMFRWSRATQSDFFKNVKGDPKIHAEGVVAGKEMSAYIKQLIAEKRAQLATDPASEDTILARMLKEGTSKVASLTDERLIILTAGLLIGAGETTQAAVVKALDELFTRPQQLQGAIAAARANNDELVAQYVWEALRFRPGNSVLPRYAEEDTVIAKGTARETKIAKGSLVLAATQSAMFDELSMKQPAEFRLDRPQSDYMLLGYGHHRCLGDYVSLIQVPQIVKALLLKKNLRRAAGADGEVDTRNGPFPERFLVEYDLD